MMFRVVFIFLFTGTTIFCFSQDSAIPKRNKIIEDSLNAISDSILNNPSAAVPEEEPVIIPAADTAQSTILRGDSTVTNTVTRPSPVIKNIVNDITGLTWQTDTAFRKVLTYHGIADKIYVQKMTGDVRIVVNNDIKFYVLLFLMFFLGIIKTAFPKYFSSMFSLSFQSSFRQLQTREQLMQVSFPAFMLNLLFVISTGLLIAFSIQPGGKFTLPEIVSVSCLSVGIIYAVKYVTISFSGWLFNLQKPALEYRFIVFYINKFLGILFLPLLLVLAFNNGSNHAIVITIALSLAVIGLCARYIISMARIRGVLNINAFHFFIYFCCAEIMPLLVLYKALLIYSARHFLIKG